MNIPTPKASRTTRSIPDRCLPAIVAVGSSLAVLPAGALELGELTVQSRLGQPLRASIAYALAPSEQISNACVTMRPGPSLSGLPGFGAARISVSNGVIMLIGETPVREPMVSAHVVVNCPYSANLSREYLLFIDPATPSNTPIYPKTVVTQQASPRANPVVVAPSAVERPVAAVLRAPVVRDIARSTRHHVQRGETLSGIASRIQDRPIGLWPAVNAIFEANPNSFTNNDPNSLKAGSWLSIPSFGGHAAVVADVVQAVSDVEPATAAVEVYEPPFAAEVAPTEDIQVAVETEEDLIVADVNGAVAGGLDTSNDSAIVLDDLTNTNVTVGELPPGEIILDTTLPGPTTSSTSPNVMTAVIATDRASDNSGPPSWLNWLAGSVIAIVFGLIMYRRRLDGQASTDPDAPLATEQPQRRFSDTELNDTQSTDTNSIDTSEVDYDILDDSPTDENLILDADLVMGTGLSESSDPDISVDVGYAASKKLDIELPFEPAPIAPQAPGELLPSATAEYAILESEVMPEHRNDDTKVTQTLVAGADADYLMLEQDYEDEMTATQALNLDVAHAAAELSARMEIEVAKTPGDETSALPLATVTELEVTAEMPARTGKNSGPKETQDSGATTANTTIDDDTIEMPAKSGKAS